MAASALLSPEHRCAAGPCAADPTLALFFSFPPEQFLKHSSVHLDINFDVSLILHVEVDVNINRFF